MAVASIATVALLAGRPARVAAPGELGRLRAEQRARVARIELAAIERDLDAMIDRLEAAAQTEVAATSDRERAFARAALSQLELELHDRAQIEQARSDELRSRLGE